MWVNASFLLIQTRKAWNIGVIKYTIGSKNRRSFLITNVTPIIRTHNILTSHNRTHKNPLEPIKNALLLWVCLPASNIWKIIVGTLLDDFLEIDAIIGGVFFLWVRWFTFYIQWERKHLFVATVEEKTRAWWLQVHKQGLHTLQTSAWDAWSDASSVKTEM
jgi:hypothetical protein